MRNCGNCWHWGEEIAERDSVRPCMKQRILSPEMQPVQGMVWTGAGFSCAAWEGAVRMRLGKVAANERMEQIYVALFTLGSPTLAGIGRALGVKPATVYYYLKKLVKAGRVEYAPRKARIFRAKESNGREGE